MIIFGYLTLDSLIFWKGSHWLLLLLFLSQDVVLQLSWVADSLQKVGIDGMTFQWREEENHLCMEQMGSAVYKVKVIHELAFVQIALQKEDCVSQYQSTDNFF